MTFTASDGAVVIRGSDGHLAVWGAHGRNMIQPTNEPPLREYFQHERDEELGRWRWPENPDYVVYPTPGRTDEVTVADERAGEHYTVMRDRADGNGWAKPAARAYFEAHPETKPWSSAAVGEVWAVTIDGTEQALLVDPEQFTDGNLGYDFTDPEITAARRIWPEGDK